MKKRTIEELKNKSVKELVDELTKSKLAMSKRRNEILTGKSKNTNLCRLLDDCAVVSTILRQKKDMEGKK